MPDRRAALLKPPVSGAAIGCRFDVAVIHYNGRELAEILFPIELFFRREDPDLWRAIPRLAGEATSREILQFLYEACRRLGTSVAIESYVSLTNRTVRVLARLEW